MTAPLPKFRYHPDPIASGSVEESDRQCRACGERRGYIYAGPVYSEEALEDSICPWCIADGSAAEKFEASYVDSEAFADGTPEAAMEEISLRTPGYNSWQSEHWPMCCGDATVFVTPAGIAEIRASYRQLEGFVLNHIIYNMSISGGAAKRLLDSLERDRGPTVYLFQCLQCETFHYHIDGP
jgi:uncharacterized protein CbrC (UPF0167 family)